MAKIQKVKYFTKEKEKFINPKNMGYYKKYLQSNIIKNQDVKDTTYYTYECHMKNFKIQIIISKKFLLVF